MSGTRRIELPADLLDELQNWADKLGMGYDTVAEGVKDAIRRRIETLRVAATNRSVRAELQHEINTEAQHA